MKYSNTPVTVSVTVPIYLKKSDFVVNFDIQSGLSVDEWQKEIDWIKIIERKIEELEKSRNEAVKQMTWSDLV